MGKEVVIKGAVTSELLDLRPEQLGVEQFIELTQLLLQCGVCQTEDLIMNTVGAGVGYWTHKRKHINTDAMCSLYRGLSDSGTGCNVLPLREWCL